MPAQVKPRRSYHSPKHAELRRQTVAAVIGAARELFAEHGYSETTIEAIAEGAGVAVQTVYAAFGNKRAILWAILETLVAGDDAPRSFADRAGETVEGVDDPRQRLERLLHFGADAMERSAAIHRIMRGAAAADSKVRAELDEAERRRFEDMRAFVGLIAGDRLSPRQRRHAADVFFAVTSYEVHDLLVEHRGWTASRWRHWVSETLAGELGIR